MLREGLVDGQRGVPEWCLRLKALPARPLEVVRPCPQYIWTGRVSRSASEANFLVRWLQILHLAACGRAPFALEAVDINGPGLSAVPAAGARVEQADEHQCHKQEGARGHEDSCAMPGMYHRLPDAGARVSQALRLAARPIRDAEGR